MSWLMLTVLVLGVFLVLNFFIAVDARLKGTVRKANPFARLIDAVNVQALKFLGVATEAVTDHVAAAEVDINIAHKEVENFEDEILRLAEEIRLQKKNLPKAEAENVKWEGIYLKAVEAGDEQGQEEAARRLKSSDGKLSSLTNLIKENEKVLAQLEAQKVAIKDGLSTAEVLKDRLAAQKTSAELRQKAITRGASAAAGMTVLKELENEVERAEARAEVLEEAQGKETSLEEKYGVADTSHDERLAALRARLNKS
jgi:phage shock protein A